MRHTWHPFLSVPPECDGWAEAINGDGKSVRASTPMTIFCLMFLMSIKSLFVRALMRQMVADIR